MLVFQKYGHGMGLPCGIVSAVFRGRWIDQVFTGVAMLGASVPSFWFGLILMQIFAVRLGWLPVAGYGDPGVGLLERAIHLVLPSTVLGVLNSALIIRFTRASMLDVLGDDYIRTARATGLGEMRVVLKHALRNALIPVLTVVGLTAALLLGGAVVTETVFGLPGIGNLVVSAVLRRDYPVIQGALLTIAAMYVMLNLVIDLVMWLFLRKLFRRRLVLIGAVVLGLQILTAVFASLVSRHDPMELKVLERLHPPSAANWMGTDEFGRDVFARIIHGGRYSLAIGLAVVTLSGLGGLVLGLLAGYFNRLDGPIMRLVDAMMSFPDILLAIALMAILGAAASNVVLALAMVYTPRVARVVRASTLVLRELLFVEAARALGVSTRRILSVHIFRNLTSPLLVQATFIFAYAILAEASLSFLGVGVPPELPTWGTMIATGQQFSHEAFWVVVFPGIAIVLAALSLQMVGDGLRDMLDPRLRKAL